MELIKTKYDIAFVDLKMPIMDGLAAVIKFKELDSTINKNIKIIAVTANVSESMRKDCYSAGMNGYITKPLNYIELKSTIEKIINILNVST